MERKYRLTRGILEVFASHDYQGRVSILTKSPTVLDDLYVIRQLKHAEVGISIATSDDALSRKLDAKAPLAHARLEALKTLNTAGVKTYVFVGPLLPHMSLRPEQIDALLGAIKDAGTTDIKIEYLNIPKYVRPQLLQYLKDEPSDIQAVYAASQEEIYRKKLEPILKDAVERHGLKLRFNEIILHVGDQALSE